MKKSTILLSTLLLTLSVWIVLPRNAQATEPSPTPVSSVEPTQPDDTVPGDLPNPIDVPDPHPTEH